MKNYYHKICIKKEITDRIFTLTDKINRFVNNKFPQTLLGNYWRVTSLPNQNIISYIDFKDHKDTHSFLDTSWEELVYEFPELQDFILEFNLENYYGTINSGNWGIHKHVFSPIAKWNMLLLGDNTADSIISFHKTEKDFGPVNDEYVYDHLPNDYPNKIITSFQVQPTEVYTLNVWEWHSFTVPHQSKVRANLFYFKNSQNYDDVMRIVDKIESYE